ncbi:MAG: LysR family transcriptional regulator [Actinomycetia bacterium]|nr:LysR family transcriptional regulator [Actinomycetes bacterium]
MELRQIRFFVAVAEDRHFGRAAERMYIAQPALSQHIRRLEHELDVRLFDRSARHVRLTPAGDAFLDSARRLLAQADEAARRAKRAEVGESGSVSIGIDIAAAGTTLPAALRGWSTRRPAVRPVLTAGRRPALLDLVRRRELDVAVLDGPVTDAAFETEVLVEHDAVVLVPATHPLADAPSVDIAQLWSDDFVFLSREVAPGLHDRTIARCNAAGFSPAISVEVDEPGLVPLAVASGAGVAVLGSNYVAGRTLAGVASRPLAASAPMTSVLVVWIAAGATRQTLDLVETLIGFTRDARRGARPTLTAVG